jgi:hypothetical protein
MSKIIILLSIFIVVSCSANESFIDPLKPELEIISFDVVQKKLLIKKDLPNNVLKLLNQWFDDKVKIDGFDGAMTFTISDYSEETSLIDDGKRVDAFLSFDFVLTKPTLSQKKIIEGSVSSYGTLSGNFNLSDFDTVIQNTQADLILRLSRDLKSKI